LAEPMAEAALELTGTATCPWARICRELRENAAIALDEPTALEARLLACHLELVRGGVDPREALGKIRHLSGRQGYVLLRCRSTVLTEFAAARFREPFRLGRLEDVMAQASEGGYALLQAEALRVASIGSPSTEQGKRYAADARTLVERHGYVTCMRTFAPSSGTR